MNKKKQTVCYYRVSTDSQSIDSQKNAAHNYLKKNNIIDFLELDDSGISANKLPISKRPNLVKIIELIKTQKVTRLITYSRDRLARNSYEYAELLELFVEHNIDVVFTATDSYPFNKDYQTEIFLAIFSQYEGMMIANRLADVYKTRPPKIYGYKKVMQNGSPVYISDFKKKEYIIEFFQQCSQSKDKDELLHTIFKFEKRIKKSTEQVLRIIYSPFYAGYSLEKGSYSRLEHVEPMISLDLFKTVIKKWNMYRNEILKAMSPSYFIVPKCALCNRKMKLLGQNLINSGRFHCSNGHKKVTIEVNDLNNKIEKVIQSFAINLSPTKIENITISYTKKLLSQLNENIDRVQQDINQIYRTICINFSPKDQSTMVKKYFERIYLLETEIKRLKQNQKELKQIINEVKKVVYLVTKATQERLLYDELFKLIKLLVREVNVNHYTIDFKLYFGEFVKEGCHVE